ncbi:MAG: ATP-dependent Clp protease ATP-binding subunit [Caldilineales bacterium]
MAGTLNPTILAPDLTQALNNAARSLPVYNRRILTPELVLLVILRTADAPGQRLLQRLARERGLNLNDLERSAEEQVRGREGRNADFEFLSDEGRRVPLSDEMLVVLDEGKAIAQAMDEIYTGTVHALAAMSQRGVSTAGLLQRYGLTPTALSGLLADEVLARRITTSDLVSIARGGELGPTYQRAELMRELLNLLGLARGRHVILLGQAGVGKRSLVQSLALLMAEGKGPLGLDKVVLIGESALLDDAAAAVQAGLRQAAGGILFLPNIQRFFGGVVRAEFPKATRLVQKALLDNGVVIIGSAAETDFNERMAGDSALAEHLNLLRVPQPDERQTAAILAVHKPRLEADYQLTVLDEALAAAARQARRYLTATPLPASAMQLLHRACALARLNRQAHQLFRPEGDGDGQVDAEDITLALSLMTGIPASNLGADERSRYAAMVEHLHRRIIGQDEAVMAVSRAVKTARVGLKDPNRPIGSFLFLGPTGVGKTELAKALAEFMFGSEEAMVVLDMSEYQQEHAVSRLLGAPPGYVGYEGGGQLTERVRNKPYTVVLFDEVEKAHPRVLDVLLQMMEEGRLTDGQGRVVSFTEAVIILTSNLAADILETSHLDEATRELALFKVKQFFRPEFLNRLDEIVLFLPLTGEQLAQILDLMLNKEVKLLQGRGVGLEITPAARAWLLAQNDHPEWGARPLRRIIQRNLREPLADRLLVEEPIAGTAISVDAGEQGLVFTVTAAS